MPNSSSNLKAALGSAAPSHQLPPMSTLNSGAYGSPAQFLSLPSGEHLDDLAKLAEQVLEDPLAVQQLSDRVVQLLQQDLKQQRERHGDYGRRG